MSQQVVVISHADADGHLIAEQTRRNLDLIPCFEVTAIIDPDLTKDHKVWLKLEQIQEIESADIVFFVDLMFSPVSFGPESRALVDFVEAHNDKAFFLIDHHPLPFRRLGQATNLRAAYRPDVFECVFGPRSGMMVVAALCEKQGSRVADIKEAVHESLAIGIRRAAALGGPLPGEKLLALMRWDCWGELAQLAQDPREFHRLPRGRRPLNDPVSDTLLGLNETAESLLRNESDRHSNGSSRHESWRPSMPYDVDALKNIDIGDERFPYDAPGGARRKNAPSHPKDLEAIVTLLEVAALSLTPEPDAAFTYEELLGEAQNLCGDEVQIDEKDVKIVLEKASFLRKGRGEYRLK